MSESDALRALMEVDRWIDRVASQRSHLPELAQLAALEDELRGLLKALQEAQAAQAPIKVACDDAAREAERLRSREKSLDVTLASSTANARELAALQNELQHVRELLERAEDRELEYMVALEPLDAGIAAIKELAHPGVARRTELQANVAQLQATLDEELASLSNDRRTRADALSSELLTRYDAAFVRVGTSGAAQVDAGRCDGCRIALSPLDVDRWKGQAAGSFMACPECGRLLLP